MPRTAQNVAAAGNGHLPGVQSLLESLSGNRAAKCRGGDRIGNRTDGTDVSQLARDNKLSEAVCVGHSWSATLAKYRRSHGWKSCWQIVNSLVPFCGLWYLMYLSSFWSCWLTLLLAVPAAGFLVRIFIIQHDCGHHSFFRSQRANDIVGHACGISDANALWAVAAEPRAASC